ncbi:MAG TPA: adenylate/guanylate cyclase domain-containing protein [Acidimicrobiia bacterium]|nr:adenylate/guanylate cyclase domain-containing protein [Acidimicrobiia bacterium]
MDESRGDLPTGTLTFLFTDIEASTRLVQELDSPLYGELLDHHNRLLRAAFRDRGGIERGTQGDSFLVIFQDAPSAVAAAVDAQRALDAAKWPHGVKVRVRMGLHSGAGILGGDDYVGVDINVAARIASAAHGGQVLMSDSTRALSHRALPKGVELRDAGAHRLKGLDQPEKLFQLLIDGLRQDFPPLRTIDIGRAHLPMRMTSFVGRRDVLETLRGLITTNRLVTLIGPGGTGKTSIAIELAREMATDFLDGVWFVDLAPLSDPALVSSTVARRLGLAEGAEQTPLEVLQDFLGSKETLLILDNFEHLLAASEMVVALLAGSPGLKLLVTSRKALGLYGEQEFSVPPLDIPAIGTAPLYDQLAKSEAVMLFVERAQTASPTFALTNANALTIAQICARLDGLPLAIELAASRIRLLEPREILTRLEQSFSLLTGGPSNLPARQQTLYGAIDWSYQLLDPQEQDLFLRLTIFLGGCTLEAADSICNQGGELGLDTFEGVASLVAHSLVRKQGDGWESRYTMLETIREFGLGRLTAGGGLNELANRHLLYFRDLAEVAEPNLLNKSNWLDRFERELGNLRGALSHALQSQDAANGLRLAASLWRFWFQRGYLREGRTWLESLLELEPGRVSAARAKAYLALGGLAYWLSDTEVTEDAYQTAMDLYNQIGDRDGEAEAAYNLAFVPGLRDDPEEGRRRFEASLALAREIGNPHLVARNQLSLGTAALAVEDAQAGLALAQEALSFFREAGDAFHLNWALGLVAGAHMFQGQPQKAREAYLEALQGVIGIKDLPLIGATLEEICELESSAGHHVEAMHLLGAALELKESTGASLPWPRRARWKMEDVARQTIGGDAVDKALAEGRLFSLGEAIEYAKRVLTR